MLTLTDVSTAFAVVDIQSDQNELHTSVDIDLIAGLEIITLANSQNASDFDNLRTVNTR